MNGYRRQPVGWLVGAAGALLAGAAGAAEWSPSGGATVDVLGVVDGGLDRGAVVTGLGWLALEGAAGDWRFGGNLLVPAGTSPTARRVGDLSVVSNIDFDGDPRLQELWIEHAGAHGALRVGLLALDAEFWGLDRGALFVNSAFGAAPGVSLNLPGPAIYPVAAAGLRWAFDDVAGGTLRVAAVDGDAGDPLDDNPHGLDVRFGQGLLVAAEYERVVERGDEVAPDRWKIALHRHSGDVVDGRGSIGLVAGIERAWTEDVGGFARINLGRRATSLVPVALEAGVLARFPGRAPGEFGIGLAVVELDERLAEAAGIVDASREVVLEGSWAIPFGAWTVQPDVQYVHRPGGSDAIDDAWVVGVRMAWAFGPH
ncbi:MAG: carbohydrate porin [Xanthomonadaceae bacterium]|jgi:porin|nr:carbohydrate porin [Xanthomonadaceae bacterium]